MIVGACSGIGRALAKVCVDKGAEVSVRLVASAVGEGSVVVAYVHQYLEKKVKG